MAFGYGYVPNYEYGLGYTKRYSIDRVSGRPIYIEDYIIPVFKGSTLETEFQFPFTLTSDHEVSIVSDTTPSLEEATVTQLEQNLVSIRWEADVIEPFDVGSTNTFRVRVLNTATAEVKVYNLITIQVF